MIWLITVLIAASAHDLPKDCYPIDTYQYCYTFSNNDTASYVDAQRNCVLTGGWLGAITDETIWHALKQKFLENFKYRTHGYVWVGLFVNKYGQTVPKANLSFVTWYCGGSQTCYTNYCLVQYPPDWTWWGAECSNTYHYFCQYGIDKFCDINKIKEPNIIVLSCVNTTTNAPIGTSIQIACAQGYYLTTNTTITCRDGKWDEVQCLPGCPPPAHRKNARQLTMKASYKIGETESYICNEGYFNSKDFRMTHFSVTCKSDSKWSNEDTSCSIRETFSTVTIYVTSLTISEIELECDLNTNKKYWLRNGQYIINNNSSFNIASSGNLVVKLGCDNIFGHYICTGRVKNRLKIGSKAYELVETTECQTAERKLHENDVEVREGENQLLACPQKDENYAVKWLKDDEQIFASEHRSIIPSTGLFLTNISIQDDGDYECQISYKEKNSFCKQSVIHHMSVLASVERVCGMRNFATSKYQPWLVVLRYQDETAPFCYGALVNNKWIVTSAFCLVPLQRMRVLEGVTVQFGSSGKEKVFTVAAVKLHPRYKRRRSAYDIGLVQLRDAPLKFTKGILPICISPNDIDNIHKCFNGAHLNGTVSGWGSLDDINDASVLDVEGMSLVPKEICRNASKIGFAEDKFCAEPHVEEKGFVGDNGSPFLVDYHERRYLLGIYTWGEKETGTGNYDYFTTIFPYYDWIKKIISEI